MGYRGDITLALEAARANPDRADELIAMVYDQLRAIAQARMQHERPEHTLQATSLVNEACVRLLGSTEQRFEDRSHFFRAAATAMQRVLIDHARKHGADKRGGGQRKLPLDVVDLAMDSDAGDVLAREDAMKKLESEDAQAHGVVRRRFCAGLSVDETAEVLGISSRTAARDWTFARARLAELLGSDA